MRKILLSFLMLIMLTPSLACAMPVCAEPAKAAVTAKMPCGDHMNMEHHGDKKEKKSSSGMLMKDCMGLELQVADNGPVIHKPDVTKDLPIVMAFNVEPVHVWTVGDISGIRGPPPDWPSHFQTQPSIILTTQRLRI